MENKFNDKIFYVKASDLKVNDTFMRHLPKTDAERELLVNLTALITRGANNFCCFVRGPLISNVGILVGYTLIPDSLDGVSYHDWEKTIKNLAPEKNSRIGSEKEYTLFRGVLIKALIDRGWQISEAWDIVCNNPKMLNSEDEIEEVVILKNLVKTNKILSTVGSDNGRLAYLIVNTGKNLSTIYGVEYGMSDYDSYYEAFLKDYTPPEPKDDFAKWLDSLSTEVPDVKAEKRQEIPWIVMDI